MYVSDILQCSMHLLWIPLFLETTNKQNKTTTTNKTKEKFSLVVGKILPIYIFSIKSIILISKITKPIWNAFECKYLHIPYELLYMHLKNTINNPSRYLALSID